MGRISRSDQILPPLPNRVEHARARVELQIPNASGWIRADFGLDILSQTPLDRLDPDT